MINADPPRFSAWLIECVSTQDRGALMGDLEEEFRTSVLPRVGVRRARTWYRRQAAASLFALSVTALADLAKAVPLAIAALLAWQVTVYFGMSAWLATDRPLATLSAAAFTVIWVFGGGLVAGWVGAVRRPHRAMGVAGLVGLVCLLFLLLGVDGPIETGTRLAWAVAAMAGAFLGGHGGGRWRGSVSTT